MQEQAPSSVDQVGVIISSRDLRNLADNARRMKKKSNRSQERNCCLLIVIAVLITLVLVVSVVSQYSATRKIPTPVTPISTPNKERTDSHESSGHANTPAASQPTHNTPAHKPPTPTKQPAKPTSKEQTTPKIPSSNYQQLIQSKTNLIQRIDRSFTQYQCIEKDPLFHTFHYDSYTMYFQTYDEIIVPSCLNSQNYKWSGARENIKVWNKQRQVTEWAYHNIQPNQNVLYYRPGVYNLPELMLLNKLVSPDGHIYIISSQQGKQCLDQTMNTHQIKNNIQYVNYNDLKSKYNFNVLIADDSVFDLNDRTGKLISDAKVIKKAFVKTTDVNKVSGLFTSYIVEKITLESRPCGKAIFTKGGNGEGFYSLLAEERKERKVLKKEAPPSNSPLANLHIQSDYQKSKKEYKEKLVAELAVLKEYESKQLCIDINSERVYPEYVLTIYGHKLYNVSKEEVLLWQEDRKAVEWIRKRAKTKDVYYETKESFNLLNIIEISYLLKDSNIHVVCNPNDCKSIQHQINKNSIKNIKILQQTDQQQAMKADRIITDNQVLMKQCVDANFLKNGNLLGHFTNKRNESVEAMRRFYVHNQLREIIMPQPKKECVDYQYYHYFWNSYHPNGYYEIIPSVPEYVIYVFWGGPPEKINQRKKFLIEELIAGTVEIKLISPSTFLYFQVPGVPIHPAYYLLTSIQKSDYVRVYIMHHYGGGYGDVKHTHFDWRFYIDKMMKSDKIFAMGYAERGRDAACAEYEGPPSCWEVQSQSHRIMGNTHYVFKKNTVVTQEWFAWVTKNLDNKYQELKKNPPQVPRQYRGGYFTRKDGTSFISTYPFAWSEIANEKLGRVQYKHIDNIDASMPYQINVDYRTNSIHDQN